MDARDVSHPFVIPTLMCFVSGRTLGWKELTECTYRRIRGSLPFDNAANVSSKFWDSFDHASLEHHTRIESEVSPPKLIVVVTSSLIRWEVLRWEVRGPVPPRTRWCYISRLHLMSCLPSVTQYCCYNPPGILSAILPYDIAKVPNVDVRDTAKQIVAIIKTGHIICPPMWVYHSNFEGLTMCSVITFRQTFFLCYLPVDEHTIKQLYTLLYTMTRLVWCV